MRDLIFFSPDWYSFIKQSKGATTHKALPDGDTEMFNEGGDSHLLQGLSSFWNLNLKYSSLLK